MEEIAMTITKTAENGTLRIALEGRLDTNTAPQLEAELKTSLSGIAGLRVLLAAQKTMSRQGKMTIRNVNETIMEVFEITGFVEILTIV